MNRQVAIGTGHTFLVFPVLLLLVRAPGTSSDCVFVLGDSIVSRQESVPQQTLTNTGIEEVSQTMQHGMFLVTPGGQ